METKQTDLSRQSEETHSIYLEGRSHVRITGVIDVESFHEEEATIRTTAGTLTLWGENMKLGKRDPDAGQVLLDGTILSLEYEQPQQQKRFSLFRRG